MTLIYARKFDDLMYIISDTAASTPLLQTSEHPLYSPQFKIQPVSEHIAFAYAGSTYFVEKMPNFVGRNSTFEEVRDACSHTARLSDGETEYVLMDRASWRLCKITSAGAVDCDTAMLGTQGGKERFQSTRASMQNCEATAFWIVGLPIETTEAPSNNQYARDLIAFTDTLDFNDRDVRGIAIPFIVTRETQKFMHYARALRAPLDISELSTGEPQPISFQDSHNGGCSVSFCGGGDWIAYHLLEAGFGMFIQVQPTGLRGTRFLRCDQKTFIEQGKRFIGHDFPMSKAS